MIQTAVIGLGWWGRHIIETLHGNSDKILIKSAFDVFPDQCIDFCLKRNISLKKDFDEILQASDIEAVILATPHSIHENQIIASAEAGKHIFCEKPLALTYRGAQFAVDACEKAGVKLGIGHERRFEPAM